MQAAAQQLNSLMGGMEGTLSRQEIQQAWQESAPRKVGAGGEAGGTRACKAEGAMLPQPHLRWQAGPFGTRNGPAQPAEAPWARSFSSRAPACPNRSPPAAPPAATNRPHSAPCAPQGGDGGGERFLDVAAILRSSGVGGDEDDDAELDALVV